MVLSKGTWCVLGLVAVLASLGMALYAKEPQAGQPGQPAGFSGKVVFVQGEVTADTAATSIGVSVGGLF